MFSSRFNIGILKHPGYNVGGGIGEAALIGAAFGGGKALVTGEDPLQAALLGGITGGAMSGVMGALPGMDKLTGAAAGVEPVKNVTTEGIKDIATTAVSPTALGTNLSSAYLPEAQSLVTNPMLVNAGEAGGASLAQGVMPAVTDAGGITTLQGIGTNVADPGIASLANRAVDPNAIGNNISQNYLPRPVESATQFGANATPVQTAVERAMPVTPKAPFVGLKEMINPEAGGTLEKGLDFAIANPYPTAGIGGAAYGMLNPKKMEEPEKKDEKSPLAGYNRDEFTPYEAPRPNPYPQAQYTNYYKDDRYAAEGGVMRSYAGGGIAALANGSPGMGGNQMYPQGLQDHTQYATPSQMPTSAEVVNSGYEMKTDPYMGTPIGMAEGGIARYAFGGSANDYGANAYGVPYFSGARNLSELSEATQSYNRGRGDMGGKMGTMDVDPSVGDYKVAPIENHYQSRYQEQAPIAQYSGPQGGMAPTYSLADSLPLLAATNPSAAKGLAQGGIASYNLGGYAAGGNPRLLKGPGDGMSDNIPATIGDRQPARLADGEFVVPADVVSHLGNGSTDAGAKHLYAMMDKVRTARTGNKKQGKQIKPQKYLPA
jgi:hypothetical protein